MKIAIPVENNRLHPHFGGCSEFAILELNESTKQIIHSATFPAPEHKPGAFPRWLSEQGVQVVVAGGIGHRALANFEHHGIAVRAVNPAASVEEIAMAYLNGELTRKPDGCRHHGHHDHHEHGDGHHHHNSH